MATSRTIVESTTCDVCGKPIAVKAPKMIGFLDQRWELDLCDKDLAAIKREVAKWTAQARQVTLRRRRTERQAEDEWAYLESLGFKRHRGRKSSAESAALAKRR